MSRDPEGADRFADDPAFAVHEGGKLSVRADPLDRVDRRPRAHLHPGRRPGLQRHRRRARSWPAGSPGRRGWSRSSPTARRCSASATSARPPRCRSWRARPACSASSRGLSAVPIVLATNDVDEIVETVAAIAPSFGGINLEDISAPRCFEIEARLRERLDIPVMHDDQHGTAIVVLAALRNAAKVRRPAAVDLRVVVAGAGAAGRRLHEDPARGRDRRHRRRRLARASCTPAAADLTADQAVAGRRTPTGRATPAR